jgi:NADH:ubiquinone oxidoreductase subunit F (NADH-binding)/NADH:ubiquinone oxidoreductase subunit E
VMHERRVITQDDVAAIARASGQPEAAVWGVATYYGDLGTERRGRTRVKVCKGTACHAACADASVGWMEEALGLRVGETSADSEVSLEAVYCLGFCNASPTVEVEGRIYGELTPSRAKALAKDLVGGGGMKEAHEGLVPPFAADGGPAIVLERLVQPIDATELAFARKHGAFVGLAKALAELAPDQVLAEVDASQLRGRGGAGFATSQKWRFAAANARTTGEAYVVCNADEGDPGSYIDKYLMEQAPALVLEGMALAGYAVGADHGFLLSRSEYPRSKPALEAAAQAAREAGWLGTDIAGSGFDFDVTILEGAGSYVVGEETALLACIEGLRGTVSARPPFPAVKGLYGMPTVVNNTETLANMPFIATHGADAYRELSPGATPGTKLVCFNERFARPGVYEVRFGTPIRELCEDLAGGIINGRRLKALQIGGPLGGILPASKLDTPFDFDSLAAEGCMLGHGGILAFDDRTDMRAVARHLMHFGASESCGKCFPCRIGLRRGYEMFSGDAPVDRATLERLLEALELGSLCAHGGGLPAPIRSLLKHFPDELGLA